MGTFARQLTLGKGVAAESMNAEYPDGVLILDIPVAEAAKPRKMNVTHTPSETLQDEIETEGTTAE